MIKLLRHLYSEHNISIIMFIVITNVVLMSAGAVLWILNIEDVVQGPWSNVLVVVFTFLSSIYALLQWHAQLLETKSAGSTHTIPTNISEFSPSIETDKSIENILQDIPLLFYQNKSAHSPYKMTILHRMNDLPQSHIMSAINADQSIYSTQRSYAVRMYILGSAEMHKHNYHCLLESRNEVSEHKWHCQIAKINRYKRQKLIKQNLRYQPNSRWRKPRLRS